MQNELPTLLGTMRARLSDQLTAAKIDLDWAVSDLPDIPNMSPKFSLHVMRIVQEATTNCIKHADCEKMILATGTISQDEVYVDIIDYGKGMELQKTEIKNQRRGISNMFYRAQKIGATLNIESSTKGTRIRLILALN